MSMNLKPAIRFQIREYLIGGFVFWAVNVAIIVLCFAGFLAFTIGEDNVISYNGYGMACAIFSFVYGILLPRQSMRLCLQMGVSRRTTFLSLLLTTVLGSLFLAAAGELLLWAARMAAHTFQVGEQFRGLFSLIYSEYSVGLSLHTLPILYTTVAMLALFALGQFFSFLFWRLNKIGCIIAGLAIPALLMGVPSLLTVFHKVFDPVIQLCLQLGTAFITSPWSAMGMLLVTTLIFVVISWLLIRRTNIRGGSLSQK